MRGDKEVKPIDTITEYSSVSITQPACIKTSLKMHQLGTLQRALELEVHDFTDTEPGVNQIRSQIGVIGDKVGSGKSLVVLALVASRPTLTVRKGYHIVTEKSMVTEVLWRKSADPEVLPVSLLVIPHGIQKQWKEYVNTHVTKELRVKCFFREASFSDLIEEKMTEMLSTTDLIIVTATMFCSFYHVIAEYKRYRSQRATELGQIVKPLFFSRFIVDEADTINIPGHRKLDSVFYWFLTSSLQNILNPYGVLRTVPTTHGRVNRTFSEGGISHSGFVKDIFCEFEFTVSRLKHIILKNTDSFVDASFQLEDIEMSIIQCRSPSVLSIIKDLVPDEIINLVASGNIEHAITRISAEKTNQLNLVDVLTKKTYQDLENLELELEMKQKFNYSCEKQRQQAIEKVQSRITEMKKKIETIVDRAKASIDEECLYCCTDTIQKPTITRCCQKAFCFECITAWLSDHNTCPNCSSTCGVDSLVIIDEKQSPGEAPVYSEPIVQMRTKLENIRAILDKNPSGKFLVFAAWDNTFQCVEKELKLIGKEYEIIKGSGGRVNTIIERYKHTGSNLNVLLLNSQCFGSGLNLENTTDIIIFHKMDSDMEKQVIGRGQRYGRIGRLRVWKLFYEYEMTI